MNSTGESNVILPYSPPTLPSSFLVYVTIEIIGLKPRSLEE